MRGALLFVWFSIGFFVWSLAVYGAWHLISPRACDLGIGALL
jgi:hypothetical protein